MSILIKGMKMPKVCAECPFREVRYDPGYYNYEHCKALGRIFNEHSMEIDVFEEKFNDCPLVEIPTPHGRLIDENAIQGTLIAYAYKNDGKFQWGDTIKWTPSEVGELISNNVSTILEAEE